MAEQASHQEKKVAINYNKFMVGNGEAPASETAVEAAIDRQEKLGQAQETDLWMHHSHDNKDHVKNQKSEDSTPEPEIPEHSKSHSHDSDEEDSAGLSAPDAVQPVVPYPYYMPQPMPMMGAPTPMLMPQQPMLAPNGEVDLSQMQYSDPITQEDLQP